MNREKAAKILGIDINSATEEELQQARDILISNNKPLTNENVEFFENVYEAYDALAGTLQSEKEEQNLIRQEKEAEIRRCQNELLNAFEKAKEAMQDFENVSIDELDEFLENYKKIRENENNILAELEEKCAQIGDNKHSDSVEEKRGIRTIIDQLTSGLDDLKNNDYKKLRASNIQVSINLKKEMASGNYLYNVVHILPKLILDVPKQILEKLKDKVSNHLDPYGHLEALDRAKVLKSRIDLLSDEDRETIHNELFNIIKQEAYPTTLVEYLKEVATTYENEHIDQLNQKITDSYRTIFDAYEQMQDINNKLNQERDFMERAKLRGEKQKLIDGKAKIIKEIRENQTNGSRISHNSHNLERLNNNRNLEQDLNRQLKEYQKEELAAIDQNDDEKAMNAFVHTEMLLSENTKIKKDILGKHSVGKKHYSPLIDVEYGNEVTDMVEDYLKSQQTAESRKSK